MEKIKSGKRGRPKLLSDDIKRAITTYRDKYPDWSAQKILDKIQSDYIYLWKEKNPRMSENEIKARIKLPGLNRVQRYIKDTLGKDKSSCLDQPWQLGVFSKNKYPIIPDATPYILAVHKWAIDKKEKPLTIRHAIWINRLYSIFGKLPLDQKRAQSLWVISGGYAWYERTCELSKTKMDTTPLDYALMDLCTWKDAMYSLMLKQGIHPKIVQERLGHSSIAITLDTYSHVAPGLQEAAAKRFDEVIQVKHNTHISESIK